MNKAKNILVLMVVCLLTLEACKKEESPWGTVHYHPKFLWSRSVTSPVKKVMDFDFSPDAKIQHCNAVLQFVDNDGKPIDTCVMRIQVNGQTLTDNILKVDSRMQSLELSIDFTPKAKGGKHQGYLRLQSNNLSRVDSQRLSPDESIDVCQWTLNYDKCMNPLAKGLLVTLAVFLGMFMSWRICLCPICFPRFKRTRKTFLIVRNGTTIWQKSVDFTGYRSVIMTSKSLRQPLANRLFTGKVLYMKTPELTEELVFLPEGKNIKMRGKGYYADTYPLPRNGVSTITCQEGDITIKVN